MRLGMATLLVIAIAVLSSCGPTNYCVTKMEIDRNRHLLPIGSRSLLQPSSGSFYFFFHAASGLTSVDHMERKPGASELQRTLYLETNRNHQLDRTVKSDVLLVGDFGTISADRTCFYNRPIQSSYSSVSVKFQSNGYPTAFEQPTLVPHAPAIVPPLSSVSLIRIFRDEGGYTLVSADYESTGEFTSIQVAKAHHGTISPGTDVVSYRLGSKDVRLDKYGIPFSLDIGRYLASHHLYLPSPKSSDESTWVIQFYEFGKLIQQQQLKGEVAVATRWLQPSVTEEEREIGPECDARFFQQQSMGLPTTGY